MKKVISAIAASVLAVSAFPISSASAIETAPANELSVSTEVLETSITVGDTVIPAGATAVTVSIDNNAGFDSSETKIELGSAYDVIFDTHENPVISKGNVLADSRIQGAVGEEFAMFASASGEITSVNGEMFTFYAYVDSNSNDDFIEIVSGEQDTFSYVEDSGLSPNASGDGYYIVGDVTDDDIINPSDSSAVLYAISKSGRTNLPNAFVSLMPTYYFSNIYVADAAFIWGSYDNFITQEYTADVILAYYAQRSVGQTYYYVSEPGDTNHTDAHLLLGFPVPTGATS